jgi:hypothetical protein
MHFHVVSGCAGRIFKAFQLAPITHSSSFSAVTPKPAYSLDLLAPAAPGRFKKVSTFKVSQRAVASLIPSPLWEPHPVPALLLTCTRITCTCLAELLPSQC